MNSILSFMQINLRVTLNMSEPELDSPNNQIFNLNSFSSNRNETCEETLWTSPVHINVTPFVQSA
jgi:hypothetical protein